MYNDSDPISFTAESNSGNLTEITQYNGFVRLLSLSSLIIFFSPGAHQQKTVTTDGEKTKK